ncbi:hypothetical protein M9H77_22269 [Catharanthus roseus]|uniref:Uncharacterized protein n=1 Tax=Catharanthus roseus TaxID=4058 RepID=A0ACC0AQN9_CATRO|nr:hypothetical protein M9H77_22269 [Catharanthus roseus]
MSSSVMFNPSCYGFGNLDGTPLELNIRKETYHRVQRPRRKCWRRTNLMLWRFDNEFFFKSISLLPCIFLQRLKIVLSIGCLLCDYEICYLWNSYGVAMLVDKLNALFVYSLLNLECLELLQGPVTRAMVRRMEEEHQRKIAIFKKMIQDFAWQLIGAEEEDFRGSKTFLLSRVQVEESKEASLRSLEASKSKEEGFWTLPQPVGSARGGRKIRPTYHLR